MRARRLLQKVAKGHNLTSLIDKDQEGSGPRIRKPGKIKGKGRGQKTKAADEPKTRKELRKEQRKSKKAQKHSYILARFGKTLENNASEANQGSAEGKGKKKKNRKKKKKQSSGDVPAVQKREGGAGEVGKYVKIRPADVDEKKSEDNEFASLKKEMEETRKRRLQEDNNEEDRYIKQMEKKLKLNKGAKVPASFKEDGLDYLLEICQSTSPSKAKDDPAVRKRKAEKQEENSSGEDDDESGSDDDEGLGDLSDEDEIGSDEEELDQGSRDEDEDEEESDGEEELGDSENEDEIDDDSVQDDSEAEEDTKSKVTKKKKDGLWEDIYGRMRRKDGSIVDEKHEAAKPSEITPSTAKYVPPMQRGNQTQRDKISRSLKGLLNRLSEANMSSISKQIEELYMTNSRNEINECMLELLYAAILRPVSVPERVILEHVMLIAILHANIGTEVGAYFLQKFLEDFRKRYDVEDVKNEETKDLENLLLMITSVYHFKIVDCGLIYDVLKLLASNFGAKDIELILAALRSVGFRLRKDDPLELKSLIILIQQKATSEKANVSSAKVKFMLDVVTAIRNNNMTKIPNYDPSVGDHLQKILKSHIHKGNYVSPLKIKMEDLLNAESKGRWWIVGSAWSNVAETSDETVLKTKGSEQNEKLLTKARAMGMNTETRKTIFCILMTSEDFIDAFNKLCHLDLKNTQEREIIHVTSYCCLHEKRFNPYYALILTKLCATDRKHMLSLQYNLWDRLKDLKSLKPYQLSNLAKLMAHLINEKSLPLSALKVIEYTEMDKVKLKFLKEVLCGILLQEDQDNLQEIFLKTATSENLHLFRESLRLFMGHFLLESSVITSDGENVGCDFDDETMEMLKERIKIADSAMSLGKSKVQL